MVDCAAPRTLCANSQLPQRSVRTLRLPAATACERAAVSSLLAPRHPFAAFGVSVTPRARAARTAQADLCVAGPRRGHTPHSVLRAQIIP